MLGKTHSGRPPVVEKNTCVFSVAPTVFMGGEIHKPRGVKKPGGKKTRSWRGAPRGCIIGKELVCFPAFLRSDNFVPANLSGAGTFTPGFDILPRENRLRNLWGFGPLGTTQRYKVPEPGSVFS